MPAERLLQRDLERDYDVIWASAARVFREAMRRGRRFRLYRAFHRLALSVLLILVYTLLLLSILYPALHSGGHATEAAGEEPVMGSMHVLAVYYEVILGGLLFILESASDLVRPELLLEAPSVFWLDTMASSLRGRMRSRIEIARRIAGAGSYLSVSLSILYAIAAIFMFLLFMLASGAAGLRIPSSLYIMVGILISASLIFNIMWLFNLPMRGMMSILLSLDPETPPPVKRFGLTPVDIIQYSMVVLVAVVMGISLGASLWQVALSIAGTLGIYLLLFNTDRYARDSSRLFQVLKIIDIILISVIVTLFIRVMYGVGLGAYMHVALAMAIYALAIIFYAMSVHAIGNVGLLAGAPLAGYLGHYADSLMDILVGEEEKAESGELLSELVYLLAMQYPLEPLIDCLYSENGEDQPAGGEWSIVSDSRILLYLRRSGMRPLRGDTTGVTLHGVMGLLVTLRLTAALGGYSGIGRGCKAIVQGRVHNVDRLSEALVRLYMSSFYLLSTVLQARLERLVRSAQTVMLMYLPEAMKRLDYRSVRYLLDRPTAYLFGDAREVLAALGRERLDEIERAVQSTALAALRTAGRSIEWSPPPPRRLERGV